MPPVSVSAPAVRSAAALPPQRVSRLLQGMQLLTGLVFAPVLFLLCQRLPVQLGWENGPLEMAQNVLLGLAALLSAGMAWRRSAHAQRFVWWALALLWLVLLGREMSWGGVFWPPVRVETIIGPYYSSQVLPYKGWLKLLDLAAVLALALLLYRAQPRQLLRQAWQQRVWAPWAFGLCCLLYTVIAAMADGKPGTVGHSWTNAQVIEEGFETVAYYFLLRAQLWTFWRWLRPAAPPAQA
ncbi:hypothetical protein [Vandammella animalimorsus]|uniref:hypothetical protein n=1 Tax=Vandammella animalimorsus TaxID=2029117 RepID=UPI0011C39022|nr:hypothetical protein [Vandammella animalimorsus]